MTELTFYHVFAEALRSAFIARRLLQSVKPGSMYIFEDPEKTPAGGFWVGFGLNLRKRALALVASEMGIPVKTLSTGRLRSYFKNTMRAKARSLRNDISRSVRGSFRDFLTKSYVESEQAQPGKYRILVHAEGRHADTLKPLLEEIIKNKNFGAVF
jgi:hypothetical protein